MNEFLPPLLDYPNDPVFEKEPGEKLALRVRHPDGLRLKVSGDTLTLTNGAAARTYDLSAFTIAQLANRLSTDGYEVGQVNAELGSRVAWILIDGEHDQDDSNGDHLNAYTSLLWCLLGSYAGEIGDAAYEVEQALRQMVMTQSEGEWLDVWATLYGVIRKTTELDPALQVRIPQEVFRLRCNALAIEKAILDLTGKDVRILEPWKQIFTLDQSSLSGPDRFQDDAFYGYHIIQPVSATPIDWSDVIPIIERNRAAGIVQYPPQVKMPPAYVSAEGVTVAAFCRRDERAVDVKYRDSVYLDWMDIEDVSIVNHTSRHIREIRRFSQLIAYPVGNDVVIHAKHDRNYRFKLSGSAYRSRYWTGAWAGNWTDSTQLGSRHSRSS